MKKDYTKIPNELLEGLAKIRLGNYEFRVIWAILRKTYGWNKKEDRIALSQFVKETGVLKQHICRAIRGLVRKGIITKRGNVKSPIISINTNWGEWKSLPKKVIITKRGQNITNRGQNITNSGTYKEHYTKNTIQRTITFSSNETLWREIFSSYKKGNREYKPFYKGSPMRFLNRWEIFENGTWLEFGDEGTKVYFQPK